MVAGERYYSRQYSLVESDPSSSKVELNSYGGDHAPLPHPQPYAPLGAAQQTDFYSFKHRPGWSRRKKLIVWGSLATIVLIIIIAVAVAVPLSRHHTSNFIYTPRDDQVTNSTSFDSGAATKSSTDNTNDGIGAGADTYTYYSGTASNFPASDKWISFENMWAGNLHTLQTSCKLLGHHKDNSAADIQDIYSAIQNRSEVSLVDHRFVFAVILQETHGCVYAGSTTSGSGVRNPGLMQSHNGSSFDSSAASLSILAMVQDGTQGTAYGDGLVQNLNTYGNAYSAARGYNSGYLPTSGNLSEAAGATACYVSDIANRLTGWANATSLCPGDDS